MSAANQVRVMGGITLLVSGALGALLLWYAAFPSMYYLLYVFAIPGLWFCTVMTSVLSGLLQVGWHKARGQRTDVTLDGWRLALGWLVLVTALVIFQVPLRAHFALAREGAEAQLAESSGSRSRVAGMWRLDAPTSGRCDASRSLLHIRNDPESYLVHAPGGIDGLCFNSGEAGHFGGDWYWMTED